MQDPAPPVPVGKTVRVRFEIAASGEVRVSLLSGTGDSALDKQIESVLSQWRWEPAVQGGQPVDSVEVFRVTGGEAAGP
ncbi:MAG: hypothetical protein AMXMBFR33_69490 [Candidatus Xenobia bacterium]